MIVMSTHSTEMIDFADISDLCNFVFFTEDSAPLQIDPTDEILKSEKLQEFILRMSHSYKNAFFAKKVFLVEGISDYMLCKYLNNKLKYYLESARVQLIPIDGKKNFPIAVKFMRLIGKKTIILTDMDSFIDDNDIINLFTNLPECIELTTLMGHTNVSNSINNIKAKIGNLYSGIKDTHLEWFKNHPYWMNKCSTVEDIAGKRAIVSKMFCDTDDELRVLEKGDEINTIKTLIKSFLDVMEKLGCFILRKGALESYYLHASQDTYDEKPSETIKEIESLKKQNDDTIKKNYNDIIRALEYASKSTIIDESSDIRQELLSELPSIIDMLKTEMINIKKDDLKSLETKASAMIKRFKKSDKSLFEYIFNLDNNNDVTVTVNLKSKILNVDGFPLEVGIENNL